MTIRLGPIYLPVLYQLMSASRRGLTDSGYHVQDGIYGTRLTYVTHPGLFIF